MHRNPIAQSTDGVRAKRGFQQGRHAWEVWWEGPLGTVAVIGVATRYGAFNSLVEDSELKWINELYVNKRG